MLKQRYELMIINSNVYKDYRDNILVDKDNPVLAFKANRDRYFENGKQDIYAGLSHLGSINSEDAITWNLIRSLSLNNDFSSIENLLNINLNNPKVLLWTLSFSNNSVKLQYIVGSTIRTIDGKHKGQITEPDIIIETDNHFIVIECKLGEYGKYPNHLWECSKESKGPEIRHNNYFNNNLFTGELGYNDNSYQLFRMAFYAYEIGKKLNKKPVLVSLTNKSWWNKKRRDNTTPNKLWKVFTNQVNQKLLEMKNIFWQDIHFKNNDKLEDYMMNHRCLHDLNTLPNNVKK